MRHRRKGIFEMKTCRELNHDLIQTLEEDHWTIGCKEQEVDIHRMKHLQDQYISIAARYAAEGFSQTCAWVMSLQALVDAGYRAGKRTERARHRAVNVLD